jgi:hypothetical protein
MNTLYLKRLCGLARTSTSLDRRICLLEQNCLIVFQVLEIVPLVPGTVIHSSVFDNPVVKYDILADDFFFVIDSTTVDQSERPVVSDAAL